MEVVLAVLGGSALAALITELGGYIRARQAEKYKTEDKETDEISALKIGMRYLMFDRIRHIGQSYLKDGEVDFDDRRILNDMHSLYHNELGGNGDLDVLMESVNSLPLKIS